MLSIRQDMKTMPVKIAICDDERRIRTGIKNTLQENLKAECREYAGAKELLAEMADGYCPDILLLDIAMDGMDGMSAAVRIREMSADIILIFITGVKEQVFQAFDVGAFHYLLKPIEMEKLVDVVKRAALIVTKKEDTPGYMIVKTEGSYRKLMLDEILYAESDGRKAILHTSQEKIEIYAKMDALEKQLGDGFYRCHRSYLVAFSKVSSYDSTSITVAGGEQIYLAKRKYTDFMQCYSKYLRKL